MFLEARLQTKPPNKPQSYLMLSPPLSATVLQEQLPKGSLRFKDEEPVHQVASESYKRYIRKKADRKINNRSAAALLAQLRSGNCLGLAHYKNRLDPAKSDINPRCEEEDETVGHWLGCPLEDHWKTTGTKALDVKTRNLMRIYGAQHPQGDVDRLYVSRRLGGRGLHSIEEVVKIESENAPTTFVEDTKDPEIMALKEHFIKERSC